MWLHLPPQRVEIHVRPVLEKLAVANPENIDKFPFNPVTGW